MQDLRSFIALPEYTRNPLCILVCYTVTPYLTLKFPKAQIDVYLVGYLTGIISVSLPAYVLFSSTQYRLVLEVR